MTNRLSIYNGALLMLGSRRLSSLSENVESRRTMDDIWDGGGVDHCLEKGFWKHAMRSVMLDYSPSVEPPFGYRRAFDKPTDLIKLYSICSDEFYTWPLIAYQDEGEFWFTDDDSIYVRYVSNDVAAGLDMSLWPESFTRYVEGYFAYRAVKRLTDSQMDSEVLEKQVRKLLVEAKANDALKEPTKHTVPTSWQQARLGTESFRRRYHPYR